MANEFMDKEDYQNSQRCLVEAADLISAVHGPESEPNIAIMSNLGKLFWKQADYHNSYMYYAMAFKLSRQFLGYNSVTLDLYKKLIELCDKLDRHEDS